MAIEYERHKQNEVSNIDELSVKLLTHTDQANGVVFCIAL